MLSKFLKIIMSVNCVKIDKASEVVFVIYKLLLRTLNENKVAILFISCKQGVLLMSKVQTMLE